MDNKYSITVRSLLGNKTEHCNELAVQRYDNMDIINSSEMNSTSSSC